MTTQIITASYNDTFPVSFTSDAWFNATAVGNFFNKIPFDWLRIRETAEYIAALADMVGDSNCGFLPQFNKISELDGESGASRAKLLKLVKQTGLVKTKTGSMENGGGTWLHPKLAIAFARWLDVKFSIWCDMQIEKILHPLPYGLKRLPEPPAITKAQAGILYNKVNAIAGGDNKIRSAVWKRFQNHFVLSSYKDLPADKFNDAAAYLEAKQEEYRQGVEMLYISTKELDLLVRERLAALPAPEAKTGEFMPKAGGVAISIHPLTDGKPKRWLVTQSKDEMATVWTLSDDMMVHDMDGFVRQLEHEGFLVITEADFREALSEAAQGLSVFKITEPFEIRADLAPVFADKADAIVGALKKRRKAKMAA